MQECLLARESTKTEAVRRREAYLVKWANVTAEIKDEDLVVDYTAV